MHALARLSALETSAHANVNAAIRLAQKTERKLTEMAKLEVLRMAVAGDTVFVERLDQFLIEGKLLQIPICGYLVVYICLCTFVVVFVVVVFVSSVVISVDRITRTTYAKRSDVHCASHSFCITSSTALEVAQRVFCLPCLSHSDFDHLGGMGRCYRKTLGLYFAT